MEEIAEIHDLSKLELLTLLEMRKSEFQEI